jgi:hypothetical protein
VRSWRRHLPRQGVRPRGFKTSADRALAHAIALGDHAPPWLDDYVSATFARSPRRSTIEMHVFPGRSSRRALVIGGVHGTESIGVEVTRHLIAELRTAARRHQRAFFTTIVVPALFPDNLPRSHGGRGRARRATQGRTDPNRQFPALSTGLDAHDDRRSMPRDAYGRPIEAANVALIELIRQFRPRRIASVHAIRKPTLAGIYADPHRGTGTALGDEAADLARRMHSIARASGGHVAGSERGSGAYPHQDDIGRHGVSLGEWASRAVTVGAYRRSALPVITIELKREWSPTDTRRRQTNVAAFARAIRLGFLEP